MKRHSNLITGVALFIVAVLILSRFDWIADRVGPELTALVIFAVAIAANAFATTPSKETP